ncbi:MAG: hypothetical protein M9928_09750 [Anaerolineae bacterium]|nr:hypothetical protein [Anaerolineae bacterium]MCO5187920.1 hypothetical protein [Anaerolineae bacterium]MCO5192679.1 hypothetical protein [Anaerolineae bacterium]MCO5197809.1 hypothetical protein [Anaerolineae bacterium]MCO5205305.1 hypothetical protein [Anaerolineae bacterium]
MTKTYIPQALRQSVLQHAPEHCGYCQTQTVVIGIPMILDHIVPEALGRSWLASA